MLSSCSKVPRLSIVLQLKSWIRLEIEKSALKFIKSPIWAHFYSFQFLIHLQSMASLHRVVQSKSLLFGSWFLCHMMLSMMTKGPTPILHQLEKLLTKFLTNIKRSDFNYLCCFHKYFGRCRHPLKRASLGLTPPRWMMRVHSTVMYRSSTTHNWRWWCTWRHRVWHLICEHKYEFAHLF